MSAPQGLSSEHMRKPENRNTRAAERGRRERLDKEKGWCQIKPDGCRWQRHESETWQGREVESLKLLRIY